MPEPIPQALLASGRELTEPRLSPDGRRVAFVQRWQSGAAIVVVPAVGGAERLVASTAAPAPGRGLGGGCFDWLADGSGLVYAASDGELWVERFGDASRRLTSWERGCRAPNVAPNGEFVVCALDEAEVWSVSLTDGAARRLDDGGDGFCFDPVVSPSSTTVAWQAWSAPSMPWDDAVVVTAEVRHDEVVRTRWRPGGGAAQQPRFLHDGSAVCVHDGSGWLNVSTGDRPIAPELFEHAGPTWGMGQRSFAESPDGSRLAFTRNERGFGRLCVADIETGVVREIGRGVHGQLSWRGDRLVALRSGARTPTQVVSYDTITWDRTVLVIGPVGGWEAADLPEPEPLEIDHDDVVLHARCYRAGSGRTICWVHGGPTDQWPVDFRPRIAYWWSRGWDVLVPDPRGSTGHGRAYQQALRGEWGRLDVDDTAAILRSHHAAGRGQPQRTVLMGSSSGGLTVLGLMAGHSGLAAGGVVLYPVADLTVLAEESHRFEAHYTANLVGSSDDATLRERSPVTSAHEITSPLLVMHGDDDPVVPLSSTIELVDAVSACGGDVELVVYAGEGHGFRDPVNRRDEYRRTAEFLSRVVDGR